VDRLPGMIIIFSNVEGSMLLVGWVDGSEDFGTLGCMDVCEDGCLLGCVGALVSDSINVGNPVLVGPMLGWRDG